MICAIHQPNFFPWYPFFQKMQNSDIFVILNHCQFEKNNYQNRFKMQGTYRQWNSLSIKNKIEKIIDKLYLNSEKDFALIKNNLPDYKDILDRFDSLVISKQLYTVNSSIIFYIKGLLNINAEIVHDYETDLTGNERLIDICKHYNCDIYLSGLGAKSYIDENLFSHYGIRVIYQNAETLIREPILEVLKKCI